MVGFVLGHLYGTGTQETGHCKEGVTKFNTDFFSILISVSFIHVFHKEK